MSCRSGASSRECNACPFRLQIVLRRGMRAEAHTPSFGSWTSTPNVKTSTMPTQSFGRDAAGSVVRGQLSVVSCPLSARVGGVDRDGGVAALNRLLLLPSALRRIPHFSEATASGTRRRVVEFSSAEYHLVPRLENIASIRKPTRPCACVRSFQRRMAAAQRNRRKSRFADRVAPGFPAACHPPQATRHPSYRALASTSD